MQKCEKGGLTLVSLSVKLQRSPMVNNKPVNVSFSINHSRQTLSINQKERGKERERER